VQLGEAYGEKRRRVGPAVYHRWCIKSGSGCRARQPGTDDPRCLSLSEDAAHEGNQASGERSVGSTPLATSAEKGNLSRRPRPEGGP
jgi:hypothetical protein